MSVGLFLAENIFIGSSRGGVQITISHQILYQFLRRSLTAAIFELAGVGMCNVVDGK